MAQALTFEELKHKTVADLRTLAAGMSHEAVKGHTQMNKAHLLKAICAALGIDMHAHHHVVGINKAELKVKIGQLKKQRDQLLEAHDREALHAVRRQMHHLKRELRKATV
jgi:hypothetical protein